MSEIIIRDTAHADWCEQIEYAMQYALGEVRTYFYSNPPTSPDKYPKTDYLLQQVLDSIEALQRSLAGGGEYVPHAKTLGQLGDAAPQLGRPDPAGSVPPSPPTP